MAIKYDVRIHCGVKNAMVFRLQFRCGVACWSEVGCLVRGILYVTMRGMFGGFTVVTKMEPLFTSHRDSCLVCTGARVHVYGYFAYDMECPGTQLKRDESC